jgi:hypothetical protein
MLNISDWTQLLRKEEESVYVWSSSHELKRLCCDMTYKVESHAPFSASSLIVTLAGFSKQVEHSVFSCVC